MNDIGHWKTAHNAQTTNYISGVVNGMPQNMCISLVRQTYSSRWKLSRKEEK